METGIPYRGVTLVSSGWLASGGSRVGTAHAVGRGPTGGEHREAQYRQDYPAPRPRMPGGAARRRGAAAEESPPHRVSDVHLPPFAIEELRQGLRELGYVEGRNLTLEVRSAEGREERLADLAAELVRLPVDLIVAHTTAGVLAAKRATTTLPIVAAS